MQRNVLLAYLNLIVVVISIVGLWGFSSSLLVLVAHHLLCWCTFVFWNSMAVSLPWMRAASFYPMCSSFAISIVLPFFMRMFLSIFAHRALVAMPLYHHLLHVFVVPVNNTLTLDTFTFQILTLIIIPQLNAVACMNHWRRSYHSAFHFPCFGCYQSSSFQHYRCPRYHYFERAISISWTNIAVLIHSF